MNTTWMVAFNRRLHDCEHRERKVRDIGKRKARTERFVIYVSMGSWIGDIIRIV